MIERAWDIRTNCADEAAMFCRIREFKAFALE
jgi:hypothetical protein